MTTLRTKSMLGIALAATLGLALAPVASTATAAESDWFVTEGAKIRLISLPAPDGKTINAGLQIDLEKGWKTYFRAPGATGLPPQLDFGGSTNIASTSVDYPVPMTFGEGDGLTAGYDSPVTLPITIDPLFAGRPVKINLTGVVGICAEVCIPVQFALSLEENGQGISSRAVASELLLAKANLVKEQHAGFMVKSAHVQDKMLTIEAVVPEGTSQSTIVVEGPSNWYLMPTHAVSVDGTKAAFEVSLADIPEDAKPEETELRLTLVSNGKGVETRLKPTRH